MPTFRKKVGRILHTYLPVKMEHTECSEMSAYKIQTLENYPEESIQHGIFLPSYGRLSSRLYITCHTVVINIAFAYVF
jgi:hypothetical protein